MNMSLPNEVSKGLCCGHCHYALFKHFLFVSMGFHSGEIPSEFCHKDLKQKYVAGTPLRTTSEVCHLLKDLILGRIFMYLQDK